MVLRPRVQYAVDEIGGRPPNLRPKVKILVRVLNFLDGVKFRFENKAVRGHRWFSGSPRDLVRYRMRSGGSLGDQTCRIPCLQRALAKPVIEGSKFPTYRTFFIIEV